jgi:hypothetical protein
MSLHARVSKSTSAFARHGHDLHNETSKLIQAIHAQYKIEVDFCKHFNEFNIGNDVMVQIRFRWFPFGSRLKIASS